MSYNQGVLINSQGGLLLYSSTKWLTVSVAASASSGSNSLVSSGLSNISVLTHGQSNAGFFDISDAASTLCAQCVSYWLVGKGTPGSVDSTLSGNTTQAGTGVYCGVSGYGSYLTYINDTTSAASSASYSSAGTTMLNSINTLTTAQKNSIQFLVIDWGETDSLFAGTGYAGNGGLGYTDKPVYEAALLNDIAKIRAAIGKTAAQLPIGIFGVTYGTFQGYAMVREAWTELAANSANNIVVCVNNTGDDVVRGDIWNSSTGLVTVGSPIGGHVDSSTNLIFAGRASLAIARLINFSQGLPSTNIPTVYGQGIGPKIAAAKLSGGNTVICTVVHDGGNDLIIPLLASLGVGFTVMDGGSISSPGTLINATACTRISSLQFSITLASSVTHAASSCTLFYPIQGAPTNANQPLQLIGRGCAVTDNYSTILAANNITLPNVSGSAWNGNYPIVTPITVTGSGSNTTATFGISLS